MKKIAIIWFRTIWRSFTDAGSQVLYLLIGLLLGVVEGAPAVDHVQPPPNISVSAGEGSFVFRGLALSPGWTTYLTGDVCNNTRREWTRVAFEIDLQGPEGVKLDAGFRYLKFENFKKDECKSILDPHNYSSGPNRGFGISKPRTPEVDPSIYAIGFHVLNRLSEPKALYSFRMLKPLPSEKLEFHDAKIDIAFVFSKQEIDFVLRNLSDDPLEIDWNKVSYIDFAGTAQRVIHKGVRFIDRNGHLPPTVVPPTARIADILLPANLIYYSDGWDRLALLPQGEKAKATEGKTCSVFIPVAYSGRTVNYLFAFQVAKVDY